MEEEPAKPGSLILENSNIIVTPHVGGGSADISDVMFPMITENIELLEEEKALKYVVNKQYILRGKEVLNSKKIDQYPNNYKENLLRIYKIIVGYICLMMII